MNRISRDEMLMTIAEVVARRSTCCRKNIGAVLARDGRFFAPGYNGAPSGMPHCEPGTCNAANPCTRTIHAEANAIAFAARYGIATEGSTLYVTVSPCNDCAKLIINSGVVRVVFRERYRIDAPIKLLNDAGIETEWYQ
jgi:dCMP deaminase